MLAMLLKKYLGCTPVVFERVHAIKEVSGCVCFATFQVMLHLMLTIRINLTRAAIGVAAGLTACTMRRMFTESPEECLSTPN